MEADGKINKDAAWYYPQTSAMAEKSEIMWPFGFL
ncbi:MAG: hypothetical protein ACK4ND_11305 [Cytophagaceae bacterium]